MPRLSGQATSHLVFLFASSMVSMSGCTRSSPPQTMPPSEETSAESSADPKPQSATDPTSHAGHDQAGGHHGHSHDAHPAHAHGHSKGYAMDFSDTDRFSAHFDDPARDAWQKPEDVVALLSVTPGETVADIGAGTGYFLRQLSRKVGSSGRVLALDVEPNMVRHMEERGKREGWTNVEPRVVPFDDPKLAEHSIDGILIVNTWHHISERERYAAKLAKALRPNGIVLVVDFTLDSDIGPPADHRLPPEQVVRELEAGGLKARLVKESLPKQYAVAATLP